MAERARSNEGGVGDDVAAVREKVGAKAADAIDKVERRVRDGDLSGVAADAKDAANDIGSAALEGGRQLFESARSQATSFADGRKNDAAQSVADIASSLRDTRNTFEDRPNIQAFIGSAADGLEQLATGLRDRSFADLYADVESYARRSPVMVGAVAALAGFALARFIKSSADELSEAGARDVARRSAARRRPASLDA